MKIGTMLGLAAIGGFFYAHQKRGGTMDLASMKQTAQELLGGVQARVRSVTSSAHPSPDNSEPLRH